jgi:hypothetical protein
MFKKHLTKILNRYFEEKRIQVQFKQDGKLLLDWYRAILTHGIIVDVDCYNIDTGTIGSVALVTIRKNWVISHPPTALNFLLGVVTNLKYV